MPTYPSPEEFRDLLRTTHLESVVKTYIFQGTPFVFRDKPELEEVLIGHLCKSLRLKPSSIAIVGSAKIGFSLSPDAFPRQFSAESDIDVIVVNERLFDTVWMTMLKWHYPRRLARLPDVDFRWCGARRKDLYWGWFVPDKIRYDGLSFPEVLRPLQHFSTQWFNAFRSLSRRPELASRNVSGRLYRTWSQALMYHEDGLRQIRDSAV